MSASRMTLRSRLIGDRRGTAYVEFAFLFPVLVTLFLGSFEVTNLMMANLKLQAAVETAGDLATQPLPGSINITPSNIDDFTTAADIVMSPLVTPPYLTNTAGLKLAFASIIYNNGNPQVAWHHEENGATPITTGSLNVSLLEGLGSSSTDSVIMVQAQYTYTSPLSYVLSSSYSLSDTVYNRPRYVNQITCTGC
jgi:Flp pilus assembly protein TadG